MPAALDALLKQFAVRCHRALALNVGELEEQLRAPAMDLVEEIGALAGVPCHLVGDAAS
jgi:hypothetical protein